MTTKELRKRVKEIEPRARVSSRGFMLESEWTIRTLYKLEPIRELIATLGLEERFHEVEGSRWNWTHVLTVGPKEAA